MTGIMSMFIVVLTLSKVSALRTGMVKSSQQSVSTPSLKDERIHTTMIPYNKMTSLKSSSDRTNRSKFSASTLEMSHATFTNSRSTSKVSAFTKPDLVSSSNLDTMASGVDFSPTISDRTPHYLQVTTLTKVSARGSGMLKSSQQSASKSSLRDGRIQTTFIPYNKMTLNKSSSDKTEKNKFIASTPEILDSTFPNSASTSKISAFKRILSTITKPVSDSSSIPNIRSTGLDFSSKIPDRTTNNLVSSSITSGTTPTDLVSLPTKSSTTQAISTTSFRVLGYGEQCNNEGVCLYDLHCGDDFLCICRNDSFWSESRKTCIDRPSSPICKDVKRTFQVKAKNMKLSLQNIDNLENDTNIFVEVKSVETSSVVENLTVPSSTNTTKISGLSPGREYEIYIYAAVKSDGKTIRSVLPCRNATRQFTRPKIKFRDCEKIEMQCVDQRFHATIKSTEMEGVIGIVFHFQSEYNVENKINYVPFGNESQISLTTNITGGLSYNISAVGRGRGNLTSDRICFMKKKCEPALPAPVCDSEIVENITSNHIFLNKSAITLRGAVRYLRVSITEEGSLFKTNVSGNISLLESVLEFPCPGTNYSITIQSAGMNTQYGDGCHFSIQTRPSDPNCSAFMVSDISTSAAYLTYDSHRPSDVSAFEIQKKSGVSIEDIVHNLSAPLHLLDLSPGSHYLIVATSLSKHDVKSWGSCTLDFHTVPTSVGNISISVDVHSFNVSWEKPNSTYSSFTIRVFCQCSSKCSFENKGQKQDFVIHKRNINIEGLSPVSHCNLTITVNAGDKVSLPSSRDDITTKESMPGVVSNFTVRTSTHVIEASWERPLKTNGIIRGYIAKLYLKNEPIKDIQVGPGNKTVMFSGLESGTCFKLTLAAKTVAGIGPHHAVNAYTKETVPSEVFGLNSSSLSPWEILVKWMIPRYPNGIITEYYLKLMKNNTCLQQIVLLCANCRKECGYQNSFDIKEILYGFNQNVVNSSDCLDTERQRSFSQSDLEFEKKLSGLTPYTVYEIVVFAATSAGSGDQLIINQRTEEYLPGVVRNIQIKPLQTGLEVSFNPPEERNGNITEYEMFYEPQYVNKTCFENTVKYDNYTVRISPRSPEEDDTEYIKNLTDLYSFWSYAVGVRAYTSEGYGNWSVVYQLTNPTTPGPIRSLTVDDVTHDSISLRWKEPCFTNGIINHYLLDVSFDSSEYGYFNATTTFNTISNLLPYTYYNITVFGVTDGGSSYEGVMAANIRTQCTVPLPPLDLQSINQTSTSFTFRWKEPQLATCVTNYTVTAKDVKNETIIRSCHTTGFHSVSCTIKGLDEYWEYQIRLFAITVNGSTPWDGSLKLRTSPAAPGYVTSLMVIPEEDILAPRTIKVKWNPPSERERNGVITSYIIVYWAENYRAERQSKKKVTEENNSTPIRYETVLTSIQPGNYTIQIYAITIHDDSGLNMITRRNIILEPGAPQDFETLSGNLPTIHPAKQVEIDNDQNQYPIMISRSILCNTDSGEVVERGVIISEVSQIAKSGEKFRGSKTTFEHKKTRVYKNWHYVHTMDSMQPYIATDALKLNCNAGRKKRAITSSEDLTFIVGKDGDCESKGVYCNGYLHPGKTYRARIYICTKRGCTESEFMGEFSTAPNLAPAIAGATVGILAVVLMATIAFILVVIHRRKRKQDTSSGKAAGLRLEVTVKPVTGLKRNSKTIIQKSNIADHVSRLHRDSNICFSEEYKLLKEKSPTHSTEAAVGQATRMKNRYTNILAYDHSRVKLLPLDDEEGTDYINANYIPGYISQREYIATQGPLECTKDDFWRMIWEQNVSVIVMLTQLVERGRRKCDLYWPPTLNEPVYFGDLIVEMESESTLDDYTLRIISVKLGDKKQRTKQFHYLKWPDMGCPDTTWLLLNFAQTMRVYLPHENPGPIVVHCSAGVGRTGTFIAVDHLMQHVRDHDSLDIFNLVLEMRNNRPNMVQTEDQYVFIHDCLNDYIGELEKADDEGEEDGNVDPTYENTTDSAYENFAWR